MSKDTWFAAACAVDLRAEAVERLALALEGVDNVEGRHGLAVGMLSVGDRILDNVLKERLPGWPGKSFGCRWDFLCFVVSNGVHI